MKTLTLLSLAAAALLAGCASGHFSSSIKTIGVNTTPPKGVVVLAPDKANLFASMAQEHNGWMEGQVRLAINRELSQSTRFQPAKGSEDGLVIFDSLRHGLVEVSPNTYAAQIVAEVTLKNKNGKVIGGREITSTGGELHTLMEFEDSRVYEAALAGAADKLALELVNDL